MEHAPAENSEHSALSTSNVDHHMEDMVSRLSNHEDTESACNITFEETISIMEVIAATGKFWHDWNILKSLLSYRLKQVLAEYPEAQTVSVDGPQPSSLLGETYPELVKRLDEALSSFTEGPPFTLQRLCEILLNPKGTYRNLSKLALALDKNLLVTSTLSKCAEPYPTPASPKSAEPDRVAEEPPCHSAPVSNGVETKASDGDEEMVEADAGTEVQDAAAQNAEVVAQVADAEVQDAARIADTEIITQVADTEIHDAAQNPQVNDTEIQDAVQVADTEMEEEKANEVPENNNLEPASDSDPARESCTASEQKPTSEQP